MRFSRAVSELALANSFLPERIAAEKKVLGDAFVDTWFALTSDAAAKTTILERCFGAGWIAIGDAAVSYDPLASRGLVGAPSSGLEAGSLVGAPEERLAAWQPALAELL